MMGYDSPFAAFPSFLLCNFLFFFASILITSAPGSASNGLMPLCLSNQSSALLQFQRGIVLRPGMLSSWKKGTDCCDWEGVTCDSLTGFVTALQIPNVSIDDYYNSSRLDPSLFELSHLRVLDLGNNDFYCTIPKRLVELTHLTHLDLSGCCFEGAVSTEISQLTRLVYLNLSSNSQLQLDNNSFTNLVRGLCRLQHLDLNGVTISMSGKSMSIVVSSSMPDLQTLSLSDCNVSGTMDESILQMRSLSYIDLSLNDIQSIPEFIQNFTSLRVLKLASCRLVGLLPSGIFLLPKLETLDVSYNHELETFLPSKVIPSTSNIQYLDLSDIKRLHGDIMVLSNLTRLSHLDLHACANNGSIPSSWKSNNMVYLDLSFNNLKGSIPTSFCLSSNLSTLYLQGNFLRGSIPSCLFNMSRLEEINLNQNLLSSSISSSVFNLASIRTIDLSRNLLSGRIHSSIFHLPTLEKLFLNNNQLIGEISTTIVNLSSLTYLDLSNNMLTGTITSSLLNLPSLLTLHVENNKFNIDLSNNMFTDNIPEEIGMSKGLHILDISNNNLSGTIPSSLGHMQQMEVLDLSCNHLTGVIPVELSALTSLVILNLSYNDLWGQIPQGNQFNSFDESSFEGNPGLCGPQLPQRPCSRGRDDPGVHQQTSINWEKDWEYGALVIGFVVGLLFVTLPILLSERLSNRYWNLIDRVEQFLMQVLFRKTFKRLHLAGK